MKDKRRKLRFEGRSEKAPVMQDTLHLDFLYKVASLFDPANDLEVHAMEVKKETAERTRVIVYTDDDDVCATKFTLGSYF